MAFLSHCCKVGCEPHISVKPFPSKFHVSCKDATISIIKLMNYFEKANAYVQKQEDTRSVALGCATDKERLEGAT